MRWNCMSKALRFVQITAKHQDFPFLKVFLIIKASFQNILITLLRLCLNFTNIEATVLEKKSPCERFGKVPRAENLCWSKIGNGVISLPWQLRCHCNPMTTNFHLNTTVVAIFPNVCLWRRRLCSDLVLTLKNLHMPGWPMLLQYGPHFFSTLS